MRAAVLALCAALAASPADAAPETARMHALAAYERTAAEVEEGRGLLKDLEALRGRYGADMDVAAVGAERDALRRRIGQMQEGHMRGRCELNKLRKANQLDMVGRFLDERAKEQFAVGLMTSFDFQRIYSDINGFSRRVARALEEDEVAFAIARREAHEAAVWRRGVIVAGMAAVFVLLAPAGLPVWRRPRLEQP